jgi:hypothetical protein
MKQQFICGVLAALCGTIFSGCETPGQSAMAGAATGAAAGALLKGSGRGVAQGAAIGAVGGYALGKFGEGERARGYAQANGAYPVPQPIPQPAPAQVYYAQPSPAPRYYQHHEHHPYGRFSGTPGFVYSPFGGGNLVDVRRIPRGAEVRDPFSGRIFINP